MPAGPGFVINGNWLGFCSVDGTVDKVYTGYSGRDYLNTDDRSGAGIIWHVVADQPGLYNVVIRYANGGNAPRSGNLLVNKSRPLPFDFEQSGGWALWQLAMGTVTLDAGDNRIDLVATNVNGLPNIDSIRFEGHLTGGDCSVALSEGEALWQQYCAVCHNRINGNSVNALRSAINNQRAMAHLKFLTDEQLRAILEAL